MFLNSFPALKHKNFRYFWLGQCISLMGTWMQSTAQQWLVYTLTKSAFLLGILGVFQFGPMLFFSLFAGAVIDRFPKKKILLITQTILMIQAFLMAALVWSGKVQYWQVLILAAILGLSNTFDLPARQSFIIELVGRKDLFNAVALNSATVNLARIAGPAIAGIIMASLGTAFCFFFNGLSFLAVLFGLFQIKTAAFQGNKEKTKVIAEIMDGLRYILANRTILNAILAMLAIGTFAMNTNVLIPVFAKEVLGQGATGYSFLLSALGFGSFVGALLVASYSKQEPTPQLFFFSGFLVAISLIVEGLINSYLLFLLIIFILGFFNITFMTAVNSTIQLNSNNEYRGRAMSVYSLAFVGTTPLGNLFAGAIMEKFGAKAGFLLCGIVSMVLLLLIITWNKSLEKKCA